MAKFGQGFIQALTQPSYQSGLFELGKAAGAAPGEAARSRRLSELYAPLMQEGATPDQAFAAAQQLNQMGDQAQAIKMLEAAKAMRSEQTAKTQSRGKGELIALANNPEFNIYDQKQQSGYLGLAEQFGVSREEAMTIAVEARQKRDGEKGEKGDARKSGETVIRDKDGYMWREYAIDDIDNPEGAPIIRRVPIGGHNRKEPQEPITVISERTGAGAFDQPGIKGDIKEAQDFSALKVEAAAQLPDLVADDRILDDAIAALDTIDEQGIPAVIENRLRSEFGAQDPDIAEYEMLVGELMYSRLKPLFGGVISEGERAAIERLFNNLKRGGKANKRILEQMRKKIRETIVKANLIRRAKDYNEYNDSLDRIYPTDGETEDENVVDFNSLP